MRDRWIELALEASAKKAEFYSGCRKILRGYSFVFRQRHISDDLKLQDAGYSKQKMSHLTRGYVREDVRAIAADLWLERLRKDKYGSVGFHCFNHLIKGTDMDPAEWLAKKKAGVKLTSKRASVMGPCIQSVSITLLEDGTSAVDLFYRTTELFKKFPADLVFIRDVLLQPFDFEPAPISQMHFHFANVTCHPMYFVTLLPLLEDPLGALERMRRQDKYFWEWTVKWTARYVCHEYERGIVNFQQAMRVRKDALERMDKKTLLAVQKYCRKNHPGIRGAKIEEEDAED